MSPMMSRQGRRYQARQMCLSIAIIPILQWRRIDGLIVFLERAKEMLISMEIR